MLYRGGGENKEFIDADTFDEDSEIELLEDPRLENMGGDYKVTKLLSNSYLVFAEYKFKKIVAYACYNGGYAAIYTLSDSIAIKDSLTEIDPDSYRIITSEIIDYYTKQLKKAQDEKNEKDDQDALDAQKDQTVDRNYFPMFPAPKFNGNNDLTPAIDVLAVYEQVADENPRCDRRYNGFMVSPLPLGILVDLRSKGVKPDEKNAWYIIDALRHYRIQNSANNDDELSKNGLKDELPLLYDQLMGFIKNRQINRTNRTNADQLKLEILDAWAKFAEYLLALP